MTAASLSASQERRVIAAHEAADLLAVASGRYARRAVTAEQVTRLADWLLRGTVARPQLDPVTVNVSAALPTFGAGAARRSRIAEAVARATEARATGVTL